MFSAKDQVEDKSPIYWKEDIKLFLFADDVLDYVENPRNPQQQ